MSRRLLEITPQYSSFVDDQVLTSAKLNEFMEYFDEQDRLTRVCLTGVGIACGFRVEYTPGETEIIVHQGCGITTDGDLLKLQNDIPVSGETEEVVSGESFKNINEMVDSINFTHSKIFTDDKVLYQPFQDGGAVITLHELVSDEDALEDEDAAELTLAVLENKVVVLYLECYEKDADLCTTTNCDNQGQPNIQNVKVLFIDKDDVENVVNSNDSIFNKHNIYEAILGLPRTAVQRVILKGDGGSNNNISTYTKLAEEYKTKITNAKNVLNAAYGDFFLGFSEILDIPNGVSNTILNQIDDLDNFTNNERIQYRYALTKNVSDTFNEIADLLLKLKAECCPDINAFPKHLLLGCLESDKEYPELRHSFYHAPVNNDYNNIARKVKSLLSRVQFMLDNFNLNNAEGIEITPSLSCGPLGKKAIPVYFDVDDLLLKAWDFEKTENFKQQYNLSFHKTLLASGSWVQNPLNFELDCTDLYRIEGHFGENSNQAKTTIEGIKNDRGLDFDCLIFDINQDSQEFTAFIKEHPSIAHKSGVYNGGTFIILTQAETVVADFCLSYKVKSKGEEQGCCSLMECTFPWISSLKYLNNLARSLNGTQSTNTIMPQFYQLDIVEYRINGVRLINNTTRISIPLRNILLRRMHAITDALNGRFGAGVVFDFNESQKRFVITRAKDDTFVLRLRDSTLGANPTYTYSNTGMYRNNLVFRPDAMRCRDLKGLNVAFYEKLHSEIAPINKDDDYGTYDDKWAKWYKLRDNLISNTDIKNEGLTRMITSPSELPDEIASIISDMKTEFSNAAGPDVDLNFQLDGDWVNGVWVNDFMLTHHRNNRQNTHDNIVLFVNLRKFLHNETGVTKLSVYITGTNYSDVFEEPIAAFKTVADFYFGSPSGEKAIKI